MKSDGRLTVGLRGRMRCRLFVLLMMIEILVLASLLASGYVAVVRTEPVRESNRQLVRFFELTDLALWTGARYTRHLSQADLFSAFQDGMGALERFPEGALAPVPMMTRQSEPAAFVQPGRAAAASGERDHEPAS